MTWSNTNLIPTLYQGNHPLLLLPACCNLRNFQTVYGSSMSVLWSIDSFAVAATICWLVKVRREVPDKGREATRSSAVALRLGLPSVYLSQHKSLAQRLAENCSTTIPNDNNDRSIKHQSKQSSWNIFLNTNMRKFCEQITSTGWSSMK